MEKDNFNANVDFVRGQADMIVLSALSDNDKYGLEILNAIQERSQGMYSLKQATLYSSLKRLEKNGYIQSYDGDVSNGAKRVYYGLTKQGRDHLNNDKSYWEFCNFLMSSLISDNKFDPQNEEKPFDPADFRPLTRRNKSSQDNEKVVVKYIYLPREEMPTDENSSVDEDDLENVNDSDDNDNSPVENEDDAIINDTEETATAESDNDIDEESLVSQEPEELAETENVEEIDTEDVIDIEEEITQLTENGDAYQASFDTEENAVADDNSVSAIQDEEANVEDDGYIQENDAHNSPVYRRQSYFDENNEVNYITTFSDLFRSADNQLPEEDDKQDLDYLTMKEMVYKFQSKGIKVKPYDKKNTMEFYINRYYYSNKLHLHVSFILFAVFAVELFLSHFICNRHDDKLPAWALVLGLLAVSVYPIARYVAYIIDPTKKFSANFNPKSTLLVSLLPVITLPIVFALMAFVKFGANINDYASMERSIILPSILLFNVPLYFIVFTLLYRTNKYHVN